MSIRQTKAASRLVAVLITLVLMITACGSADGEIVVQADATPVVDDGGAPADNDEQTTPTVEPTAEPTVQAPPVEPTAEPTVQAPTPEPTSEPTPQPIPIELPSLVGQEWYVVSVDSATGDLAPRPTGAVARIRFTQDGAVLGNAACNEFSAGYTIGAAGELSITNLVIGDLNCFIPDWEAFVELLPGATGYGSAGGPDPILFVDSTGSISLSATPPAADPGPSDPSTDPTADYIGLTEIEAAQLADSRGVAFRVSSIDGEPLALTLDFAVDRVNADLVDGIVIAVTLG